jgi:hypothetical protein
VGGGIPKMRHYFGLQGWPATSVLGGREPASEEEKTQVVEVLQAWKTEKYKEIIGGCCWQRALLLGLPVCFLGAVGSAQCSCDRKVSGVGAVDSTHCCWLAPNACLLVCLSLGAVVSA